MYIVISSSPTCSVEKQLTNIKDELTKELTKEMDELEKEKDDIMLVLSIIPRGETEVPLTINLDKMSPKVRVYCNYDKKTLLTKFDAKNKLLNDLRRATIASMTEAQVPGMYFLYHDSYDICHVTNYYSSKEAFPHFIGHPLQSQYLVL